MRKRLILGDIHGHIDFVKQIYEYETPNDVIILGDYCDSYTLKQKDIADCFNELLLLKSKHKCGEFNLLIGNHDLHYMITSERYSGKNYLTESLMHETLMQAWDDNILKPYIIDEKKNITLNKKTSSGNDQEAQGNEDDEEYNVVDGVLYI